MAHAITKILNLCALLIRKPVLAPASDGSPSRQSTSTARATPTTDSGTSARNAIKLSVVSRNPRLTDAQADSAATQVLDSWVASGKSDEELKQLMADVMLTLTDRSAHLGSIATMSEVMYAASLLNDEEGTERLHLKLVEQSKIADDLFYTLKDIDQILVLIATALNELTEVSDDPQVQEKTVAIRQSVMLVDDHIRTTTDRYESYE